MQHSVSVLWQPCADGARVLRLFGDTPCPAVPAMVGGLPVTEIGPYCFRPDGTRKAANWKCPPVQRPSITPYAGSSCRR